MKKYFIISAVLFFCSLNGCFASTVISGFQDFPSTPLTAQVNNLGLSSFQQINTPLNSIDGINIIAGAHQTNYSGCFKYQLCKSMPRLGSLCLDTIYDSQYVCGLANVNTLFATSTASNSTQWSTNLLASTTICTTQHEYYLNFYSTSTSALTYIYTANGTSSAQTIQPLLRSVWNGTYLKHQAWTNNTALGNPYLTLIKVWGGDIQSCVGTTTVSTTTINITGESSTSTNMTTSTNTPSTSTDIGIVASFNDGVYTYYQVPFLLYFFIFTVLFFSIITVVLYIKLKKK